MKYIAKSLLIFFLGAFIIVSLLFLYFNLPGPKPRQDVALGITFSSRYAESLGLSWKETYVAILDDVKVKKVRIPLYWDLIEKERGEFDFSDIDWQLEEAKKRNVDIVLAMGQKVPRWPECFTPNWIENNEDKRVRLFGFERMVIDRYKDHSEIVMWQIENEPFLKFGNCPDFDIDLLDEEIALVKSLDSSRPILTTDSGELSIWVRAAKRGDIFGTTMYRDIWSKRFGYVTYPLGPNFFLFKEMIVRLFTDQKNFIVIELQGEPWVHQWIVDTPLQEQFGTMDENRLRENVEYAKQVGFSEIYLWGAEWWYWMKVEKNYPAVWDTAIDLFATSEMK